MNHEHIDDAKIQVCSICHETFTGFGNNAEPLEAGRCCDNCINDVLSFRKLKDAPKPFGVEVSDESLRQAILSQARNRGRVW